MAQRKEKSKQPLVSSWPGFLSSIGTLIIAIAGIIRLIIFDKWRLIFGIPTIIGTVAVFVGGIAKQLQQSNKGLPLLEQASSQESYSTAIKDELFVLSKLLGFGIDERISLYWAIVPSSLDSRDTERGQEAKDMIMIGRYSQSQKFDLKGKAIHSLDSGVLGSAWHKQVCHITNLPSDEAGYMDYCCNTLGMDREVVGLLRMKSRALFVSVLESRDYQQACAALVFESMNPKKIQPKEINDWMKNKGEAMRLEVMLGRLKDSFDLPDPGAAAKEGF